MKKNILVTLAILLGCIGFAKADVGINSKNFPDVNFRFWVQEHFNKPNGATLSDEELASVKSIVSWKDGLTSVSSLKGIEFFSELETLDILYDRFYGDNTVEIVDLTMNKKLKKFIAKVQNNSKTYLSIVLLKNLPELEVVDVKGHNMSILDFRGCPKLKSIRLVGGNSKLNVVLDKCENLEEFECSKTPKGIESLDLSLMPNLKSLNCDSCNVDNLNLSAVNNLDSLNCASNNLKSLDLSYCKKLRKLNCGNNPLLSLDCSHLDSLTSIDISRCKSLSVFPVLPSGIKAIVCDTVKSFANADLSRYTNLTKLSAKDCGLTSFDAPNHPNLTKLNLSGNHIAALDLSKFKNFRNSDIRISQQLYLTAVPMPEQKGYWRFTLPQNLELNKIYSYDFYNDYASRHYTLYSENYQDGDGVQRLSFVANHLGDENHNPILFFYDYKTGAFYIDSQTKKETEVLMTVYVYVKDVASGVNDIASVKEVKGVKYYDLQGHESVDPFSGFNIEVTQFTDGSSLSKKFVR
ncbi:MAG: leucine-rich repeat domain-containing protein [Bacteroidales bacterium]|nr:leucine-rich repeat domain-containing protein [Bacteroidales bacterium]